MDRIPSSKPEHIKTKFLISNTLRFLTIILALIFSMNLIFPFDFQVLSTNPAPIEAGEYADITVRIDFPLTGEESREIKPTTFFIKETDDIRPLAGQEFNLISIRSGQSVTKTFRVFFSDSIPTGEIPLTLIARSGLSTVDMADTIFIQRAPRKVDLHISSARSTPEQLIQDTKSNTLRVTLQNLGERDAQMISATLRVDDENHENIVKESFFNSMQDSISQIVGGWQEEFSFIFDLEKTALNRIPMVLDITYRVQNPVDNSFDRVEESIPVELRLRETPRFEIISVEPENELQAGASGNRLRIQVQNVGEEEGKSVRMRLFPDPSAPFDFERTTVFISSSMQPGDVAEFIIPFDILNDALVQSYYINADIESLVGSNRFDQSKRVEIRVEQEASDGLGSYLIILLIITIGGSLVIGFFYNRSNNNSDKNLSSNSNKNSNNYSNKKEKQ
ncbi:MAG: COG1361 S-layer family protein [Candidatus Woesearchaeota archaeon]